MVINHLQSRDDPPSTFLFFSDEIGGPLNPREGSGFLGSEGWFDTRTADLASKSFLGKRRNISEITKFSFHDKSWGAQGIILVDYFRNYQGFMVVNYPLIGANSW